MERQCGSERQRGQHRQRGPRVHDRAGGDLPGEFRTDHMFPLPRVDGNNAQRSVRRILGKLGPQYCRHVPGLGEQIGVNTNQLEIGGPEIFWPVQCGIFRIKPQAQLR